MVGSGPVPARRGHGRRLDVPLRANPDYWQGAPHIDEVVFRVYKAADPMVQALDKGEIDFAEDITAAPGALARGQDGITAQNGDSPGFDEIAFNTGAVDLETDEPVGDGHAALEGPGVPATRSGYAIDRDLIIERAYQGAGEPGDTIIPAAYSNWQWTPPEDGRAGLRPRQGRRAAHEAGYTLRRPTVSA